METIKKYQGFIAIGIAAIGLVGLIALSSADNQAADTSKTETADKKTAQTDTAKETTKAPDSKSTDVYNYTAQSGDSYTVLARKAVQTYGINAKVNLTQAQIVAAETRLAVDAGSIELNEGQTLAINKSAVKAAVDAVRKLSAEELSAWEAYVPYVDFNTNAAGRA